MGMRWYVEREFPSGVFTSQLLTDVGLAVSERDDKVDSTFHSMR